MSFDADVPVACRTPSSRVKPRIAKTEGHRPTVARWFWPHLLSLDAPVVAVVWQNGWARAGHLKLPWYAPWVLGLGVWTIYVADRLADSVRAAPGEPLALRHRFHFRWRVILSAMACLATAVLVLTTPVLLPWADFFSGLLLLMVVSGYFWLIHGGHPGRWTRRLPKEAAVGAVFAVGVAFFPWSCDGFRRLDTLLGLALFGGLCFCNCALITRWENHPVDVRDRESLLNAFPRLTARLRWVCLVIASLAGAGWVAGAVLSLPLALSGVLLALLDAQHGKISPPALRVLADVALLTPLLVGNPLHR